MFDILVNNELLDNSKTDKNNLNKKVNKFLEEEASKNKEYLWFILMLMFFVASGF